MKPCPFCHHTKELEVCELADDPYQQAYVWCSWCNCCGPTVSGEARAVDAWNSRNEKYWQYDELGQQIEETMQ